MKVLLIILIPSLLLGQSTKILFEEEDPFIMTLEGSTQVIINVRGSGTIVTDWGDGTTSSLALTTGSQNLSHTYGVNRTYTVRIYNPSSITWFVSSTDNNYIYTLEYLFSKMLNLTTYQFLGSNAITGNLSSLPARLLSFDIRGSNTVMGNLSSLPAGTTYFGCSGLNTTTGSLNSLPAGITYFDGRGSNTINDYTAGKVFSNDMNYFRFIPSSGGGLSSTEIDNLIIDLDGSAWAGTGKTLILTGTNSAPTATSAAARTSLSGKGVSVTTN